jgi:hypothetical protein
MHLGNAKHFVRLFPKTVKSNGGKERWNGSTLRDANVTIYLNFRPQTFTRHRKSLVQRKLDLEGEISQVSYGLHLQGIGLEHFAVGSKFEKDIMVRRKDLYSIITIYRNILSKRWVSLSVCIVLSIVVHVCICWFVYVSVRSYTLRYTLRYVTEDSSLRLEVIRER